MHTKTSPASAFIDSQTSQQFPGPLAGQNMYPALSEGLPLVELSAQSSIAPASSWSEPPIVIPSRGNGSCNKTHELLGLVYQSQQKKQNKKKKKYHNFPVG
jgi:hypothetical protein